MPLLLRTLFPGGSPDRIPDLGCLTAVHGKRLPERADPGSLLTAGTGGWRVGCVSLFPCSCGFDEAAPAAASWRLHRFSVRPDSYYLWNHGLAGGPPVDRRVQAGPPWRIKPTGRKRLWFAGRGASSLSATGAGEWSVGSQSREEEGGCIGYGPSAGQLRPGASGRMAASKAMMNVEG